MGARGGALAARASLISHTMESSVFSLPQFPLTMGVYRMAIPYDFTLKVFSANLPCQLRYWGQEIRPFTGQLFHNGLNVGGPSVLCGPGSDIRDVTNGGGADLVEVPAGSGRWYLVGYVDDVAKGFANEYRCAFLWKVAGNTPPNFLNFPNWPSPIP